MNQTFVVATMYRCDEISEGLENYQPDQAWRTTALGCKILGLLQLMYHFQITYVNGSSLWSEESISNPNSYLSPPDIYARPLPFTRLHEYASPTNSIINRRYGFVLIAPKDPMPVKAFFIRPFTFPTWGYIAIMTFLILTPVQYFLGRWEMSALGQQKRNQDYSVTFSLLTVIGACFQHTPPVHPKLTSRRVAYATLLIFTYVLHAYYTSNLLSYLVNDKGRDTSLAQLVDSDYEFITLDTLKSESSNYSTFYLYTKLRRFPRIQRLREKLSTMTSMTLTGALAALKTENRVALLSDYITINPYLKAVLDSRATCNLIEVDLITNIKEYIFTAKRFPLHEEFKVGILRIIEAGVLRRIKRDDVYSSPRCPAAPPVPRITSQDVFSCLMLLPCAAVAALLVLALEIRFGRKYWPYLD